MVACRASGYASPVRPLSNGRANTSEHHLFRAIRNIDTYLEIIRDGTQRTHYRNRKLDTCSAWATSLRVVEDARHRDARWQRWQLQPIRQPALKPAVATASGLRMAQRTLRRLVNARQVLRGQAPDGSSIYALS